MRCINQVIQGGNMYDNMYENMYHNIYDNMYDTIQAIQGGRPTSK